MQSMPTFRDAPVEEVEVIAKVVPEVVDLKYDSDESTNYWDTNNLKAMEWLGR